MGKGTFVQNVHNSRLMPLVSGFIQLQQLYLLAGFYSLDASQFSVFFFIVYHPNILGWP